MKYLLKSLVLIPYTCYNFTGNFFVWCTLWQSGKKL